MEDEIELPDVKEWFLSVPLYREFEWQPMQGWRIIDIQYFDGTLDSYCINCRQDSIFKGDAPDKPSHISMSLQSRLTSKPIISPGTFKVVLRCTRVTDHRQYFIFNVTTLISKYQFSAIFRFNQI